MMKYGKLQFNGLKNDSIKFENKYFEVNDTSKILYWR